MPAKDIRDRTAIPLSYSWHMGEDLKRAAVAPARLLRVRHCAVQPGQREQRRKRAKRRFSTERRASVLLREAAHERESVIHVSDASDGGKLACGNKRGFQSNRLEVEVVAGPMCLADE